jgi:hypothetical protein
MWLALIARFWPHLLVAAAIIGAGLWLRHSGYESGYAASEVQWLERFAAAERAREAADERARQKEAGSIALTQMAEAEHAKTLASINLRAAGAERRYASLLRQRSAASGGCAVRQDSGATSDADATRAGSELIDRTSRDFAALARRCESDAAALTDLQQWVTEQRAIINR